MSVRDEMARATAEALEAWAAMNRIDEPAQTVEQWVADALMPIVERVAREVASVAYIQGFRAGTSNDFPFAELAPGIYDEIVRRVVGS